MLLTRRINAFESRWPLNTYRDRGASKLSVTMLERVVEAEGITLDEHRANLAARERIRGVYARLAEVGEACITLAAASEAPVGIESTGPATFVVVGSLLGVPAVSLPVLACNGLPLGLQVLGFAHKDGELAATAAGIAELVIADVAVRA